MKPKSKIGLRAFQLKVLGYGNSYYIERIARLEKALAKMPRRFQIDLIGDGEIPADWALLIRSVLLQRAPRTLLITHARSSLQGGTALVWLMGDLRLIRNDARLFFRRVEFPGSDSADTDQFQPDGGSKYQDSFTEVDPEDADYAQMLQVVNEYLPVRELAGKIIHVPELRQFGLVENETLDRFLATAFGHPVGPRENPAREPRPKRARAKARATPTR